MLLKTRNKLSRIPDVQMLKMIDKPTNVVYVTHVRRDMLRRINKYLDDYNREQFKCLDILGC